MSDLKNHTCDIYSAKVFSDGDCAKLIETFERNKILAEEITHGERENTKTEKIEIKRHLGTPAIQEADKIIFDGVGKALNLLAENIEHFRFMANHLRDSGYDLKRVVGETRLHPDGLALNYRLREGKIDYRVGTMVMVLSDTEDTLVFPNQDLELPMEKGTMIFFPPYWNYPHYTTYSDKPSYRVQTWLINEFHSNFDIDALKKVKDEFEAKSDN